MEILTFSSTPPEGLVNLFEHLLAGPLKRRQHSGLEDLTVAAE